MSKVEAKNHKRSSNNTTTVPVSSFDISESEKTLNQNWTISALEGVRGSSSGFVDGPVVCAGNLYIHNIELGFDFGVLFGEVGRVLQGAECFLAEASKQRVCKLGLQMGRRLVIVFNPRNGGQVHLNASENPLCIEEFFAFANWYLPGLFTLLTGRVVRPEEFYVLKAPEFNIDLPGVFVEGFKSLKLSDYLTNLRIYVKKLNGEMYTRVEVWNNEFAGVRLDHLVKAVKTLLYTEEEAKFRADIFGMLEELNKNVGQLEKAVKNRCNARPQRIKRDFEKLPKELQNFLRLLRRPEHALIRIRADAIEFGDAYWRGMQKYNYNFGLWLEEELRDWSKDLRPVVWCIITAIYHYNKAYNNEGVPWKIWRREFVECLSEVNISLEEALEKIRGYLDKKACR